MVSEDICTQSDALLFILGENVNNAPKCISLKI